jgi:transcription elongation GreA/GreB family factor
MSKAFTKEDEGEPAVLGRPVVRGERPITARGHAELAARFTALEADIVALGPASEATTMKRAAMLHERDQLTATLADVRVHAAPASPRTVSFGCRVHLRGERGERVLTLVGPDEAEPKQGRISVMSPVGQALLGAEPGSEVELRRPGGAELVTVTTIEAE